MNEPPRPPDGHRDDQVDSRPDDSRPDDLRDDRLAALLAVEPLDDVTRRRLVRTALDGDAPAAGAPASGRRPRAWWAAAAAAVVVAIAAGTVVLASGGGDERPTAQRATTRDRAAGASTTTAPIPGAPALAPETADGAGTPQSGSKTFAPSGETAPPTTVPGPADSVAAAPVDLGQLGDVTDVAVLRSRVQAADDEIQASPTPRTTTFACASTLAKARPDLGPAQAVGIATYKGAPASVAVASRSDGTTVIAVVVDKGCVVHEPVTF